MEISRTGRGKAPSGKLAGSGVKLNLIAAEFLTLLPTQHLHHSIYLYFFNLKFTPLPGFSEKEKLRGN